MIISTLYSDVAGSTLAGPISAGSTTLSLATGGGALFPSPAPGTIQYFSLTLRDAASGLVREIVQCTARNGDTLTVQRAREGTTAQAFLAGDKADLLFTADNATRMVQRSQMSSQSGGLSAIQNISGNPNGQLTGVARIGSMPPDFAFDFLTNLFWFCKTSGTAGWAPLNYAFINGDATKLFATAPATSNQHAVNLGQFANAVLQSYGYQQFPSGQIYPGGLIFNWQQINVPTQQNVTATLLNAYPNLPLGAIAGYLAATPPSSGNIGVQANGNSRVTLYNSAPPGGSNFVQLLSWGY